MASESATSNVLLTGQSAYVKKNGSMVNFGTIERQNALTSYSLGEGYIGPNSVLHGTDLSDTNEYLQCEAEMRMVIGEYWEEDPNERTIITNSNVIKDTLLPGEINMQNLANLIDAGTYTELEYIQSTGGAIINTLDNVTNTLEFDIKVSDVDANCIIFGAQTNSNFVYCGVNGGNRNYEYYFYDTNYQQSMIATSSNTYKNVIFHKGTSYFDIKDFNENVIVSKTRTVSSYDMNRTLYIGTNNNGSVSSDSYSMKIHYYKSYNNGVLTKHLIPVKRTIDNEICLYDLISKTFYTNQGSGSFVAGPVINN